MPEQTDRFELARQYQELRGRVLDAYDLGFRASHKRRLAELAELARRLHDAEHAAGVPIGSTREELGFAQPLNPSRQGKEPE